jgi:hypothetical protein
VSSCLIETISGVYEQKNADGFIGIILLAWAFSRPQVSGKSQLGQFDGPVALFDFDLIISVVEVCVAAANGRLLNDNPEADVGAAAAKARFVRIADTLLIKKAAPEMERPFL